MYVYVIYFLGNFHHSPELVYNCTRSASRPYSYTYRQKKETTEKKRRSRRRRTRLEPR